MRTPDSIVAFNASRIALIRTASKMSRFCIGTSEFQWEVLLSVIDMQKVVAMGIDKKHKNPARNIILKKNVKSIFPHFRVRTQRTVAQLHESEAELAELRATAATLEKKQAR